MVQIVPPACSDQSPAGVVQRLAASSVNSTALFLSIALVMKGGSHVWFPNWHYPQDGRSLS